MAGWLKKFGQAVVKGIQIVNGYSGVAELILPGKAGTIQTVSHDLAQIADVILDVEALGAAIQLPGPQKLTAAAVRVEQIILKSAVMVHHDIANPELFKAGVDSIAQGMVDILNSVKDRDVKTLNKAA